jgi:predicted HAD superfamily Cof-like phosphohydrolase
LIIHVGKKDRPTIMIVECENDVADIVEAYDALLDLEVVTTGSAVAFGLDTEPGWQEVHRSNMSKFIDGHRREDGKWVKGPSYSPAKLAPIIEEMKNHDEKHTPTGE